MGGDLLTFDEALAELQMATHELRSLVAQGELRAFREDDALKFRRTDILDLKKSRESQTGGAGPGMVIKPGDIGDEEPPVVKGGEAEAGAPAGLVPAAAGPAAPPAPGGEVKSAKHETEETELLPGAGQGAPADFLGLDETATEAGVGTDTAQTVVPTIEVSDEEGPVDDTARTIVPTVAAGEEVAPGEAATVVPEPTGPAMLAEGEEETEMATQEIGVEEGTPTTAASPQPAAQAAEPQLQFAEEATAPAAGGEELGITTDDMEEEPSATAGVTAPRRSQRYREEDAAPAVSPVFTVLAIATFVVLLLALPLFYGLATDSVPEMSPYKDIVEFFTQKTIR